MKSKKGLLVSGLAAVLAALAVVLSVGMASADPAAGTSASGDTATATAHSPVTCDNVAMLEQFVAFRAGVIGADAATRGSTAWVRAELAAATTAGNSDRVAKMQKILDVRAAHPDAWAKRATRLQNFQKRQCS